MHIVWIPPGETQGVLTRSGELGSLGVFEDRFPHNPGSSLEPLPLPIRGFDTLFPVKLPVSAVFLGVVADLKLPPTPRLLTIPLPQEAPEVESSTSLTVAKPTIIQYNIQSMSNENVGRAPANVPGQDSEVPKATLQGETQGGEGE